MRHKYGEMFARMGIPNMGRQGMGWCGIGPDGVLVIMSHQKFYEPENGVLIYRHPGTPRNHVSPSVRKIAEYFEPGKRVLLPVGIFLSDGGWHPDGRPIPSKFDYATGDVYRGTMREFDPSTAYFVCDNLEKFRM